MFPPALTSPSERVKNIVMVLAASTPVVTDVFPSRSVVLKSPASQKLGEGTEAKLQRKSSQLVLQTYLS